MSNGNYVEHHGRLMHDERGTCRISTSSNFNILTYLIALFRNTAWLLGLDQLGTMSRHSTH